MSRALEMYAEFCDRSTEDLLSFYLLPVKIRDFWTENRRLITQYRSDGELMIVSVHMNKSFLYWLPEDLTDSLVDFLKHVKRTEATDVYVQRNPLKNEFYRQKMVRQQ